jgi:hypothetical protein
MLLERSQNSVGTCIDAGGHRLDISDHKSKNARRLWVLMKRMIVIDEIVVVKPQPGCQS